MIRMPRILYIAHPEADYGGGFIYNGLCDVVGAQNIFDLPIKWSYHGQVHHYATKNIAAGCTAPFPWMRNHACAWDEECQQRGTDSLVLMASTMLAQGFFDFVIVEAARTTAMETFSKLQRAIESARVPVVVHDGEDYREMQIDTLRFIKPTVVLKRERQKCAPLVAHVEGTLLVAFPFSSPLLAAPSMDIPTVNGYAGRQYDVAMLFGPTDPMRTELVNAFTATPVGNSYCAIGDRPNAPHVLTAWAHYLGVMSNARLAVSARGYGVDTCRYWEAPFCAAMLCDDVDLAIPNPFTHNETCFMFSSAAQAVTVAQDALSDAAHVADVFLAGQRHLLQYHTNEARVRYFLDLLWNNTGLGNAAG